MSEAEKYINEHTNYRSNFKPNGYHEWVTPDDALKAEWLNDGSPVPVRLWCYPPKEG